MKSLLNILLNRVAYRIVELMLATYLLWLATNDTKMTMFGAVILLYVLSSKRYFGYALSRPMSISIREVKAKDVVQDVKS